MATKGNREASLVDGAFGVLSSWSMEFGQADTFCSGNAHLPTPKIFEMKSNYSGDDSPISQFRKDSVSIYDGPEIPEGKRREPQQKQNSGEELGSCQKNTLSLRLESILDNNFEDAEDEETLRLEQARAAISIMSAQSPSRLSDARIQQILVAAMRFEKDKAPSDVVVPTQSSVHYMSDSNDSGGAVPAVMASASSSSNQQRTLSTFEFPEFEEAPSSSSSPDVIHHFIHNGSTSKSEDSGVIINGKRSLPGGSNRKAPNDFNSLISESKEETKEKSESVGQAERPSCHGSQHQHEDFTLGAVPLWHPKCSADDPLEKPNSLVAENTTLRGGNAQTRNCGSFVKMGEPKSFEVSAWYDMGDEKKETGESGEKDAGEGAYVVDSLKPSFEGRVVSGRNCNELRQIKSLSMTESDVGSTEGLPTSVQSTLRDSEWRDEVLQRLDGVENMKEPTQSDRPENVIQIYPNQPEKDTEPLSAQQVSIQSFFDALGLSFLCGTSVVATRDETSTSKQLIKEPAPKRGFWGEKVDEAFDALGHCSAIVSSKEKVPSSMVQVNGSAGPSFGESVRFNEIDTRLHAWINTYYEIKELPPIDGTYDIVGKSRTVVVHEIRRGNWTWCTAWSPKGDRLAIATENHHLAVVQTTASTVWRIRVDKKLSGPACGDTTHSIRSISWGKNFIATGGTGNAVSIISPSEPYPVMHIIKDTGFVGSLDWRNNSNILAIGSRLNKVLVVQVRSTNDGKHVESELLFQAECENWVNCVAFNPSGMFLAVGDATGTLSVYDINYEPLPDATGKADINTNTSFQLDDAILAIDWSADGRWLYAGGEDFHISVIETKYWQILHKKNRSRWVQCIASSSSGSHVAVGGVSSEVSILDARENWDSVMGVELKGLVPLSAAWHPKDQALALTGQNDFVLVVETSNARHVKGHHLHSMSPIIAISFSPDGRNAIVGNEAGIVTFFGLSKTSFESSYELAVILNDRLSIDWSSNGLFSVIGSKDAVIIVGQNSRGSKPRKLSSASGLSVQKVIRNIGETNCVSIDCQSRYVAVAGDCTRVLDATNDFQQVKCWTTGTTYATAWSPDGAWLATIGKSRVLSIYDIRGGTMTDWKALFNLRCDFVGQALAWGPSIEGGLLYLAYAGGCMILIMEIRTLEGTWETVLRIPRDGDVNDLDWGRNGLLAAGIGDGTVSIIDLAYLQSGIAVNEKDYNWQRQALTCFTEIRRNRGKNSFQSVQWIPSSPGSDSLLAVGGTDGEIEIVDLTERRRCRGYNNKRKMDGSDTSYHRMQASGCGDIT